MELHCQISTRAQSLIIQSCIFWHSIAALPRVHVEQYVIEQCRYIALPWHERNGVVELPTGEQVTGIARGKKPRGMLRAK